LERLLEADGAELDRWSANALEAARRSSWTVRAEEIVALLDEASR
jgi:hypothetical protein